MLYFLLCYVAVEISGILTESFNSSYIYRHLGLAQKDCSEKFFSVLWVQKYEFW